MGFMQSAEFLFRACDKSRQLLDFAAFAAGKRWRVDQEPLTLGGTSRRVELKAKSVLGLSGMVLLASTEMLSVAPGSLPRLTLAQSASAVAPPPDSAQQAVLNKYCMGCHNDKVKTGGFSLTGTDPANVAANTDLWEKVLRKLEG